MLTLVNKLLEYHTSLFNYKQVKYPKKERTYKKVTEEADQQVQDKLTFPFKNCKTEDNVRWAAEELSSLG